jgi:hypothetical protein
VRDRRSREDHLERLPHLPFAAELTSQSARTLGDALAEVVAYDHRMAAAAHRAGLPVSAPG